MCTVNGQGQKREQKYTTKNFVEFHNHSPLITMVCIILWHLEYRVDKQFNDEHISISQNEISLVLIVIVQIKGEQKLRIRTQFQYQVRVLDVLFVFLLIMPLLLLLFVVLHLLSVVELQTAGTAQNSRSKC